MRPPFGKAHDRWTDSGPLSAIGAGVLIGMAFVWALGLAACGPNASLRRHAAAATMIHDAAVGARAAVLEQLEADVATATAGVADPAERIRLAAEVRARYTAPGGPVDRANAVNRLGLAYVRAVLVVEREEWPTWAELGPPLRAAIEAYAALRHVVGHLPAIPAAVAGPVP